MGVTGVQNSMSISFMVWSRGQTHSYIILIGEKREIG